MIQTEISTIVRYSEVDQMKIVYHSHYYEYFEIGRIDWINKNMISYIEIEKNNNIGMSVIESFAKFILPSKLGDQIKIITIVSEKPTAFIKFDYELYVDEYLITTGYTKNVFVNLNNMKICRPHSLSNIFDLLFR